MTTLTTGPATAAPDPSAETRAMLAGTDRHRRVTDRVATGLVVTAPTSLELGLINYRTAIKLALGHGYNSAFLVEHYGGDGVSVSATNRDYLRRIEDLFQQMITLHRNGRPPQMLHCRA